MGDLHLPRPSMDVADGVAPETFRWVCDLIRNQAVEQGGLSLKGVITTDGQNRHGCLSVVHFLEEAEGRAACSPEPPPKLPKPSWKAAPLKLNPAFLLS